MQHTLRANYQAAIWRRSLENLPDVPAPSAGHGWELDDGGSLKIRWMGGLPAPDVVLGISLMHMQKDVSTVRLLLHTEWVEVHVVCKLQGCSNMVQDDAIVAQDANDSDGDSDD
ncbi:hypothetical protein GWK47_043413 [Chionoecetes opilio]|uniref:Uncharacterized protein n=1 Tax=Chionoecetes opilio TaxID=41210 RepID=A0A8J4YHI7_CHIOP|nr:hypothetical protein GWK47_043413 [Chionoecetes opilio]